MKKFLPILLAALIIFPAITAESATILVPNFIRMGKDIEFTGMSSRRSSRASYDEYSYECSGDELLDYVEKYIELLTSEYPYEIVGQTKSKNNCEWRLASTDNDGIRLESSGKSIRYRVTVSENNKPRPKSWHICITTHDKSVDIKLARGISMD
ncbi:MAG: hypothetical protein J5809_00180 [Selenomonadaceae bacterium]|nr:hypothetical protein [Selenomonadaceae bacterium]